MAVRKRNKGAGATGRPRLRLEKALGLLVALTLVAMVAERPILKSSRVLDADDGHVALYDDGYEGGASESEVLDPDSILWRCDLADQAQYTFCGLELILDPGRQEGLDLRQYDRVRFWLDYRGPTESIRLYLRNFDPAYSDPLKNDTTKYNQVEFDAELARQEPPLAFAMADFFVANWWFQRYRISPEMAHPQFDNIVVLEVQTGSDPLPGEHQFRLQRVEFIGQVIPTERWYQGIMAVWLLMALFFLGSRVWQLKRELGRTSQRERELLSVNALLDARGRVLQRRAQTDPLTGAFNRQGVEEAVKAGLEEFRKEGKPLSVIMLDVDHFKPVNDTYGHAVGDRLLSGLSRLVTRHIRSTDRFARWGGEEFLLVCRDTRSPEAAQLAEKLRALAADEDFGEAVGLTASFGVASLRPGESVEALFERVDRALYQAKEAGRSRVVTAD